MARMKGSPKSGGRRKGTPNKTTVSVKAALTEAFDRRGGVEALVKWGKEEPAAFYALWGKLIPREMDVTHDVGSELRALLQDIRARRAV